jgi:2-polyprenyl-6-methoxyphenol hydroxylase-like FAD-dependent oxidoreductase
VTTSAIRVTVIGAGPTGLTLAYVLARAGVPVTIVDAASSAGRESSRATTVHAGTLEALDRFDSTGEEIASAAAWARKSFVWAGSRRVATVHWDRMPTRYAAMINLRQEDVEAILRGRLEDRGVEVEWDRSISSPDQVDASYVVACDGARSAIRRSLDIALEGSTFDERFLLADVRLSGIVDRQATNIWVSTAGVLGILPLPDGSSRLNGTLADGETVGEESLADLVERRLGSMRGQIRVEQVAWAAEYRTHSRLAAAYRRDRVFLAGDAAHLNSPVGGQGMNVGIGDAIDLGLRLAAVHTGSPAGVLDAYETHRRRVAQHVIRRTEQATTMLASRRPIARLVRNQLLRFGHHLPPFQRRMSTETAFLAMEDVGTGLDQKLDT